MDNAIKSERLTFVCTPNVIQTLNALVYLRQLRGEKTPDGRWTASRILSAALSEYFEKHSEEIKQAKSVQNIVNFR